MKKVLLLVEGQTEERFVKDVLYQYFFNKDILLIPKILTSKEVKSGPNFKGGILSYKNVRKDLNKLLLDTSATLVTSMFDYYGLPSDFPATNALNGDCYNKVSILEEAFSADVNNQKFLPYIQLHEFETILFSDGNIISQAFQGRNFPKIKSIIDEFQNPELINNDPSTCPSRRIAEIFPEYNKVIYGSLISNRIGIDSIKQKCTHFSDWIDSIQARVH